MSALLADVAAALAEYGRLRCDVTVDQDRSDQPVVVTLTVDPYRQGMDGSEPFARVTALLHAMQYVADVAQIEALCEKHGIEKLKLEAVLPPKERT